MTVSRPARNASRSKAKTEIVTKETDFSGDPAAPSAAIDPESEAFQATLSEPVPAAAEEIKQSLQSDEPQADWEDADEIPPVAQRRKRYDSVVAAAVASLEDGGTGIKVLRSTPDRNVGSATQTIHANYADQVFGLDPDNNPVTVDAYSRTDPKTGLIAVYVQAVYSNPQD